MYLTELRIRNFQQHENLVINFTSGCNFIVGKSGCGKSTILRAICFLFWNEPHKDSVIRPDKKSDKKRAEATSVIGILDNGIEVEHVKSASVNRYVIRKKGCEEIVYDCIGTSVPDEVKKIFGVGELVVDKETLNLNMAEQISLPFLYDKSGTFRLKLFNQLTGTDLVDKIVQNMNKEILQIGKDIKVEQEFISTNEPKLQDITQQHQVKAEKLGKFDSMYSVLKVNIIKVQKLQELQAKIQFTNDNFSSVKDAIKNIKIISDEDISIIKKNVERYEAIKNIFASLSEANSKLLKIQEGLINIKEVPQETIGKLKSLIDQYLALDDIKAELDAHKSTQKEAETALAAIKAPKIDLTVLKTKIEHLKVLQELLNKVSISNKDISLIMAKLPELDQQILALDRKYTSTLKEAGCCPVCKRSTCEEHT